MPDGSTSQNIECKVGEDADTFIINPYTFDYYFSCPIVFTMHYESSPDPIVESYIVGGAFLPETDETEQQIKTGSIRIQNTNNSHYTKWK